MAVSPYVFSLYTLTILPCGLTCDNKWPGSARTSWGSLQCTPYPLAGFKGALLREGRKAGKRGKGGECGARPGTTEPITLVDF